jgi:Protein of unknown function (DUF3040)
MALSMDEQRMLAEIERRLAAEDPGLASCLTTFRRPGPASVLRSPRARIIGSLFTVLLVAMVSLMVYAMIPFRAHAPRPVPSTAGPTTHTSLSAGAHTRNGPPGTQQASASANMTVSSSTGASAAISSAGRSSGSSSAKPQEAKTHSGAAASSAATP